MSMVAVNREGREKERERKETLSLWFGVDADHLSVCPDHLQKLV
jgi:hypothetical protein